MFSCLFLLQVITIPTAGDDSSVKRFNFSLSPLDSDGPQGSVECIEQKGRSQVLQSLGRIEHKLKVHATDESFGATKAKMTAASNEAAKKATKVIKAGMQGRKFIPPPKPNSFGLKSSLSNKTGINTSSHLKNSISKASPVLNSSQPVMNGNSNKQPSNKFDINRFRPNNNSNPLPPSKVTPSLKRKLETVAQVVVSPESNSKSKSSVNTSMTPTSSPENRRLTVSSLHSSPNFLSIPKNIRQNISGKDSSPHSVSNYSRDSLLSPKSSFNDSPNNNNNNNSHYSSQINGNHSSNGIKKSCLEIKSSVNSLQMDSKSPNTSLVPQTVSGVNTTSSPGNSWLKKSSVVSPLLPDQERSCQNYSGANKLNGNNSQVPVPTIKLNGNHVHSAASTPKESSSRPPSRPASRPTSPAVTREGYEKLKMEYDNMYKKYLHLTSLIEPVTQKFNRLEAKMNSCTEGSTEWNVSINHFDS